MCVGGGEGGKSWWVGGCCCVVHGTSGEAGFGRSLFPSPKAPGRVTLMGGAPLSGLVAVPLLSSQRATGQTAQQARTIAAPARADSVMMERRAMMWSLAPCFGVWVVSVCVCMCGVRKWAETCVQE